MSPPVAHLAVNWFNSQSSPQRSFFFFATYINLIQDSCVTPGGSFGGAKAPFLESAYGSIPTGEIVAYSAMEIIIKLIRRKWMLLNSIKRWVLLKVSQSPVSIDEKAHRVREDL